MAINTQKLLPSKSLLSEQKKGQIVKISSSNFLKRKSEPKIEKIKKTLVSIDIILKSELKSDKKDQIEKRKEEEKEEFEKEEKKLEAPKEAKKFNFPKLSIPGASFLDRIKRFLFFTALGWLFTKFQDQLPKLLGIVKVITQVYGVVENIFKFLLESFVNFIDRGYKTYDKIRELVKSIGGEKAQQDFDNLSSKLNEYINYALIGGMALTGAINAFNKASKGASKKIAEEGTKKAAGEIAKRASTKGIAQRTAQVARIGARKATQAVIGKQATRQLLRLAKGPLSRLPILGGLVEFGLSWALGDPVGKAAFRGIGTILLGAVGSVLLGPGFGTFVGGWAGAELAGKLYEVLFENKKPQGKVQKKQGGGPVTRGGETQGAPTRSIKITRRRPQKIRPKQSQPGKDVGGKKKIRELYPDPSVRTDIEGEQKGAWWNLLPPLPANATPAQKEERDKKIKALPNSYKALTGVSKILKDIPFGIGALMGGAVDIALGQKLPNDAINNLSNGISYLINAIANRQVSTSLSSIEKEITKMQVGGVVPRSINFKNRDEFGLGKDIGKVLEGTIRSKVDDAIREVQKQLMPGKYGQGAAGPGRGPSSGPTGPIGPVPSGPITTVPGIVDQQGRPVRFAKPAADAFILMMESAKKEKKPFKGSDIASTYRDPKKNEEVGGATNSKHLYGLAADIHGTTGAWIRSKGRDYGWVPYDYEGTHGGHYEYVGGGKKEKATNTLPDIFKQQPGQLPDIFQRPGQSRVKQSGVASWYGPGFYGNQTASGDTFRKGDTEYTAAHQTLPFGTKVTVTNKANGKSIQVRINDRGPFEPGRIIDLNKAARDALGGQDLMNVDLSYQRGGYVPKQSPKNRTSSLSKYPSYSAEGGMMIAIQPMIIERTIPVPMSQNKTIIFPVPVSVNNSNMQRLSRG